MLEISRVDPPFPIQFIDDFIKLIVPSVITGWILKCRSHPVSSVIIALHKFNYSNNNYVETARCWLL